MIPAIADGGATNLLDQIEDGLARVIPNGVAEQTTEQTNVLAKRQIQVRLPASTGCTRRGSGRSDGSRGRGTS
jgi:hypothetical protein